MSGRSSQNRFSAIVLALLLIGGASAAQAQNAVISGKVVSDVGAPAEGTQVYIQELNVGALVNAQGQYHLTVPGERVHGQTLMLRARRIGLVPAQQQITLNAGAQTVNFTLKTDVQHLSEVVVTGVTAATTQAMTPFTVQHVDASQLKVPAANALSELQGKVPGANIVTPSGRPGASPEILLRGPKSIDAAGRGQGPLYVVDGIILNGPLPDLNPLDIQSVEVVEGAAASSLYGARAANGVIQITTKRGSDSKVNGVHFTLRSEYGINDVENSIPIAQRTGMIMNETDQRFCAKISGEPLCAATFDYGTVQKAINNSPNNWAGSPPSFAVDPGSVLKGGPLKQDFQINRWPGKTYNSVDQFVKPKATTQQTVDMTARFDNTNVYASASYLGQGGAIRFLSGYQRSSARLNVDQALGTDWTVSLSSYYSHNSSDGFNQEDDGGAFFSLNRTPPIVNLLQRDTLGRLYIRPNLQGGGQQNENALYSLENDVDNQIRDRYLGNLNVHFTPLDWLRFSGNFGYDLDNGRGYFFQDKGFRTTRRSLSAESGQINNNSFNDRSYNTSLDAGIDHDFGSDLTTRWTARFTYEQQDGNSESEGGDHLSAKAVADPDNATQGIGIGGGSSSIRRMGLIGSLDLTYKSRYILSALVRRDGSSLFGSDNRWATFGRASVAWRMAQEPWWPIHAINEFKLHASYGEAGNVPSFSAQYETFSFGSGGILNPNTLGNKDLRPEVNAETEYGLDMGLFNRATLNVTYYNSNTRDQILLVPLPAAAGFGQQWQNAGTLKNEGWEASLDLPLIVRKNVNWSTHFSYSRDVATITALNAPPFNIGTNIQATGTIFKIAAGQRFPTFYGRQFINSCSQLPSAVRSQCGPNGAYQKNDDGFIVWVGDGNSWHDGVTKNLWETVLLPNQSPYPGVELHWGMPIIMRDSTGTAVQAPLGHVLPDYKFSVSTNFSFKRLTLYGLLDASIGGKVWNEGESWDLLDFLAGVDDQTGKSVETAKPLGYYYRAAPPDNGSGIGGLYDILGPNSFMVQDDSYAKLREAMVSYHVGPVANVGDWSVSVVGRNLLTFTKYKGFDPEVGITSNVGSEAASAVINAVDIYSFPNLRTITFGLSTTF
ncbi:MAG TPA: SusC/RagA family TonB-linked outer membrane protein [Gemmatimonadaceae bacterium]|nr:SusC/RagA family TonB-linked outer membrane protein [Gemmatimonadaceae bacterium]